MYNKSINPYKNHSKIHTIKQRGKHIKRKIKILKNIHDKEIFNIVFKNMPKGKLSKGKIHCGCYMCKPYKYDNSKTVSDMKKLASVKSIEKEYYLTEVST